VVSASAQVTTEGSDFWLGFMQNNDSGTASSLELFITSNQVVSGTIEVYKTGEIIEFNAFPGFTFTYVIANEFNNPFAASGSGRVEVNGIHVTADGNISLYAFNKRFRSADATVVLPTPTLGQEYIAATFYEVTPGGSLNFNNESELLVVATEDQTEVEITPSVSTLDGKSRNSSFTIELDRGEVYQLQATGDLTGTVIRSISSDPSVCKNIAVFGGNKWSGVGECGFANDHLYEQMFPVNTWGKNFTIVPFAGRNSNGDLYRIISSEASTKVTIATSGNTSSTQTISGAGDYITANVNTATSISADKPIQVVQFSKSLCAELGASEEGDPFMLMVSPNEQMLKKVTFNTLESDVINSYYTTIITETASREEVKLNSSFINASEWNTLSANTEYSYARIDLLGNRNYTLEASNGFISYVYGFGNIESFGYAAGASLDNLNLEIEPNDEQIGILVSEGCIDSQITFDVLFETPVGQDPLFTNFDWDFGNGEIASGKNVTYTYTEAGKYSISVIASDGQGACANTEFITHELTILDIEYDGIEGPASVCPDVVDVAYSVSGPDDNLYEWFISDGGAITSSTTQANILVDWGPAKDDAWLKLLVKNSLECAADTIQFDVKINKRLEPAVPLGPVDVCFLDLNLVTYSTPATNGSEYEWFVSAEGAFLSDNTLNTVDVKWQGVGTGQIWYREYNPAISDCEGYSEKLDVIINSEIQVVETIIDVVCFGESNGAISLEISGGKPGYEITWSNGAKGLSVNDFSAGTYTASIYDAVNCLVEFEYEVKQPDLLEIVNPQIVSVQCFQESNGEVNVDVLGGTAPYAYDIVGMGIDKSGAGTAVTDLIAGLYTLEIFDANGCKASIDLEVTEPALLEPDLDQLVNAAICPQANNGEVYIDAKGGTPGYQFFWNTAPSQEGNTVTGLSQGNYTVTIIDANGCQAEMIVAVEERFPRIYIPNAFNPNSDEIENRVFKAITDCTLSFNMKVFNKWGLIIFSTSDINEGWDGSYKNQPAASGNYSYSVFYSGSINGIPFEESIKSTVRLFR
jgi:gliding motility-associated-like protein